MNAVVIHSQGGTEVLKLETNYPVPTRSKGEVLIKLHSTSVDPVDTMVRDGTFPVQKFPKILGGNIAGEVVEADEGSKFKKGDRVFALTPGFIQEQSGSYAEYATVPEDWLAYIPDNLPSNIAGGVPLVGLTAWQAIMDAKPQPGQRVLILAGAGGVGHIAVQLAKALGLFVVATAGTNNVDFVKNELGADEVVDYRKADYAEVYTNDPFDILVDSMAKSGDEILKAVSVLKPTGCYSHIVHPGTDNELLGQMKEKHAKGEGVSVVSTFVHPNGSQLQELADLMAANKVKLVVHQVYPLSEVAAAQDQVATGHTRGKVILRI